MDTTPFGITLENTWTDYRRCAAKSVALKKRLDLVRLSALGLFIGGTVVGVLAAQLPFPDAVIKALAMLSAAAIALSAYLTGEALDSGVERGWVEARAVGEALKSEAYKYMAKAAPYDGPDAAERLARTARALRMSVRLGSFTQIGDGERLAKLPSTWLSPKQYIQDRVLDQIAYYDRRAAELAREANVLKLATIGLGALAVLLAAARAVFSEVSVLPAWIGVIGTVAGAVTTYIFANRLLFLTSSYENTSLRLTFALEDWSRVARDSQTPTFGEFVNRIEDTLTLENRQWVAELDRPARHHEDSARSASPGA